MDPHVVVLFGATGDLARRKLIPGLAYLDQSELAPHIEIVATSLEDLTREEFLKIAKAPLLSCAAFSPSFYSCPPVSARGSDSPCPGKAVLV